MGFALLSDAPRSCSRTMSSRCGTTGGKTCRWRHRGMSPSPPRRPVCVGYASSPDGIHWTKHTHPVFGHERRRCRRQEDQRRLRHGLRVRGGDAGRGQPGWDLFMDRQGVVGPPLRPRLRSLWPGHADDLRRAAGPGRLALHRHRHRRELGSEYDRPGPSHAGATGPGRGPPPRRRATRERGGGRARVRVPIPSPASRASPARLRQPRHRSRSGREPRAPRTTSGPRPARRGDRACRARRGSGRPR